MNYRYQYIILWRLELFAERSSRCLSYTDVKRRSERIQTVRRSYVYWLWYVQCSGVLNSIRKGRKKAEENKVDSLQIISEMDKAKLSNLWENYIGNCSLVVKIRLQRQEVIIGYVRYTFSQSVPLGLSIIIRIYNSQDKSAVFVLYSTRWDELVNDRTIWWGDTAIKRWKAVKTRQTHAHGGILSHEIRILSPKTVGTSTLWSPKFS